MAFGRMALGRMALGRKTLSWTTLNWIRTALIPTLVPRRLCDSFAKADGRLESLSGSSKPMTVTGFEQREPLLSGPLTVEVS